MMGLDVQRIYGTIVWALLSVIGDDGGDAEITFEKQSGGPALIIKCALERNGIFCEASYTFYSLDEVMQGSESMVAADAVTELLRGLAIKTATSEYPDESTD